MALVPAEGPKERLKRTNSILGLSQDPRRPLDNLSKHLKNGFKRPSCCVLGGPGTPETLRQLKTERRAATQNPVPTPDTKPVQFL